MKDIQEIFNELQGLKKDVSETRKDYRNILTQDPEYQSILDDMEEFKINKKATEESAKTSLGSSWEKLEENVQKIKDLEQIITDVAMTNLMDGKTVEVRDEWDTLYEPIYKINFKKAK
jgi:uncharacterized coiled-coil DUF342 family protein